MIIATRIVQIIIGLIFFVFGLNGFLKFLPFPEPVHPFMELLISSGYLYVIKALEVIGGLCLLINKKVSFGLTLLGPIVVNILLFHTLLDPRGLVMSLVIFVLYWFLVYRHWPNFKNLLND